MVSVPRRPRLAQAVALLCGAAVLLVLPLALGACGDRPGPGKASTQGPAYDQDGRRLRPGPTPGALPNLVVIVIDTLRRDAVALHEGEVGVMPRLSALAREGVAFAETTAPAPWTVPSLVSMLTGLLPHEHGCVSSVGVPRLPPSITTYAEILKNGYGYETAVFTGAPWFHEDTSSILQGFGYGDVGRGFGLQGTRAALERWLAKRDARRPFFLLLHTFEAHDPYGQQNHPYPDTLAGWNRTDMEARMAAFDVGAVREPWQMARVYMLDRIGREALRAARGDEVMDTIVDYTFDGFGKAPRPDLAEELRGAYLDGLTWVDGLLDPSLATLREMGLMENTLLVVTGDHGEAFGEDGALGHGRSLSDALLRVPLVMRGPAPFAGGRVVDASVGLVDVLPTFFGLAGIEQQIDQAGTPLGASMASPTPGGPVVSEEVLTPYNTRAATNRVRSSVRDGRWKYLIEYDITAGRVRESVYDLQADPAEAEDLVARWKNGGFPWGEAFCAAVARVRERVWNEVDDHNALAGTMYAGSRTPVTTPRPASCEAAREP